MQLTPFIYHDTDDLMAHTYVLAMDNGNCIVIDPSNSNDSIINFLEKNSLNCVAVLLTHAHFDHMRGVDKLVNKYNAKLYVGFDDVPALKDQEKNCSYYCGTDVVVNAEAIPVADNEILHLIDEDIKVIYTPYHTCGSVSYYLEKSGVVFTGDSLFANAVGRTDLPTSTPRSLEDSISKLMKLPDDVKVYPGHGRFTTIGTERRLNPFVK